MGCARSLPPGKHRQVRGQALSCMSKLYPASWQGTLLVWSAPRASAGCWSRESLSGNSDLSRDGAEVGSGPGQAPAVHSPSTMSHLGPTCWLLLCWALLWAGHLLCRNGDGLGAWCCSFTFCNQPVLQAGLLPALGRQHSISLLNEASTVCSWLQLLGSIACCLGAGTHPTAVLHALFSSYSRCPTRATPRSVVGWGEAP